jgi:ABC-type phosphate transport system substrate-binding protein
MSARYRGGGSGGGTGSLECGIDIGMEDVGGDEVELYELDEGEVRNRSEGFESLT